MGGLVFGDLTAATLALRGARLRAYAALFTLVGNWLSLQFPKRVEFGKRMNRTGVAGLLLVRSSSRCAVPLAAVAAAHFAGSHAVKYVILAAFAAASFGLYLLLSRRRGARSRGASLKSWRP